ncbi:hypothetical protein BC939DRAFT_491884, partial [Gamsiella multidivaricata]|uniref:uncharacterized protein n=1 Tax=Gamsiella multidivaricata TaxID=101098 RepID=UPI00221E4871
MPSPSTSSLSASSSSVESNTQVLHALDLPEIRQQIASNLEKADLAQCILVSQKWSSDFLPLYWREVNVRPHKLTRCSAVAIKRQGHHIRTLFAGRIEDTSVFNQPSVLHLQHLEVSTCGS